MWLSKVVNQMVLQKPCAESDKGCIAAHGYLLSKRQLSLSILCLISLVLSFSLQPRRQKPPNFISFHLHFILTSQPLSLPPSNSCTSMLLCFLPLFLQIRTISLSLFLHLHEPAEHSFPSLQSLAADGSLKARRKVDALLRLLNRCYIQSHHQIFCLSFIAMARQSLGNFCAALLHRHNIPSNSFQTLASSISTHHLRRPISD